MTARRRLVSLLSAVICLTLPGCSGCVKQPTKADSPPPSAEQPAAPPQDFKPADKSPEQAAASKSESKPEAEGRPGAESEPDRGSTAEAKSPSGAPPIPAPRTKVSGARSVPPETQIRDWLKQARREQAAGHPGKAYVLAADASGLVRRVKDAGQRAALQAEVDTLLAAIEPAVERATRNADTRTDDKPLIEK